MSRMNRGHWMWLVGVGSVVALLVSLAIGGMPLEGRGTERYPTLSEAFRQSEPTLLEESGLFNQPVVIRFSSSWCHSCQSLDGQWQDWVSQRDYPVIEIWLEPSPTGQNMVQLLPTHWRLYDPNFQWASLWGVEVIPQTLYYLNDRYQARYQGSELPQI